MFDTTTLYQLRDTVKNAARSEQTLHLSTTEVVTLSGWLEMFVQDDVLVYLLAMQDPEADDADDKAFVRASSAQFWADDDPADSIYDDLYIIPRPN